MTKLRLSIPSPHECQAGLFAPVPGTPGGIRRKGTRENPDVTRCGAGRIAILTAAGLKTKMEAMPS
jgi:hypothetical protein